MAPVQMNTGRTRPFPRLGAWTLVGAQLAIIFALRDETPAAPEGAEPLEEPVQVAVLHLIDKNGETISDDKGRALEKIVPAADLAPAPHEAFASLQRAGHITPYDAALKGYPLSASQVAALSPLQKRTLGMTLTDSEAADAAIEESRTHMETLVQQKIAAHPDALALEAQIESERQAFIADVERRRSDVAAKIRGEMQ